jgi:hypothetical protein
VNGEGVVGSRDNQYRDRGEVHAERGHSAGVPASVSEDEDRKGKFSIVPTEMIENPRDAGCSLDTVVERSPGGDAFLETAIAYVQRGWPVLPVQPRGKRPLGRLAPHGFKNATLDEGRIEKWWRAEPEANVGLVTGIAFDVLDIDGDEGLASINRAAPWYGEPWDGGPTDNPTIDGPTSQTGRGWHVLVGVTGLGNRTRLLPGVDWKGERGYVVAPPSIHATGSRYQWFSGWSPEDQSVREAPAWLLDLLGPSMNPVVDIDRAHDRRLAQAGGTYGRRALEIEVGRVALATPGTRNEQLNKSAFAIGQLIAGGKIPDAKGAVRALVQAGLAVGLPERESLTTVRSGIDAGSSRPRQAPGRIAS